MASVNFSGRAIPLYFSVRLYPKSKEQYNQKKLESSFLRELRHLLSKKYSYTIATDRGFGNDRVDTVQQIKIEERDVVRFVTLFIWNDCQSNIVFIISSCRDFTAITIY